MKKIQDAPIVDDYDIALRYMVSIVIIVLLIQQL